MDTPNGDMLLEEETTRQRERLHLRHIVLNVRGLLQS